MEITQFKDLDKIAARVARAVRSFLRRVPVRASSSRARFDVTAWYEEGEAPKARKAKRRRKASEDASVD